MGLMVHKTEKAFDAIQMCLGGLQNFREKKLRTTRESHVFVIMMTVASSDSSLGGDAQPKTLPVVSMYPSKSVSDVVTYTVGVLVTQSDESSKKSKTQQPSGLAVVA